jgi:hypothetical protein
MKIWINLKKSYVIIKKLIINVIEKKKVNFMKLFQNN